MYRTIVLGACVAVAAPAWAADIYRCTDTQGRVEYRDEPCSRALGQTGSTVTLPPLNFVRETDQSAARAAGDAIAARMAERARREEQQRAGMPSGAVPLWQVPGGLPVQATSGPGGEPKPPIVIPPAPPSSLPANATSAAAAAAIGNPALPSATPPKALPSIPVNATSGAVAGATGVAGK